MPNLWITSDTHFGHRSIFHDSKCPGRKAWCGNSIEEHDAALTKIWNSKVAPEDYVIHLGDFAFGGVPRQKAYRDALNGHLWIALGNHDSLSKTAYRTRVMRPYDIIQDWLRFEYRGKKIFCKHVPYEFTEKETSEHDELWHGHVHDRKYAPPTLKHRAWGVDRQEDLISLLGNKEEVLF